MPLTKPEKYSIIISLPETLGVLIIFGSKIRNRILFAFVCCSGAEQLDLCSVNMFRISKGYDHTAKTIRLPVPLAEKIELLATENNLSFNQLVIQCLEYALENLCEKKYDESD